MVGESESEGEQAKEGILSDYDKERLLESGESLMKKFLRNYPDKLPDAIILPETSAAPLRYLLDPVLEKVAEERGVSKPRYYSFVTQGEAGNDIENYRVLVEGAKKSARSAVDDLLSGRLKGKEWLDRRRRLEDYIREIELWQEDISETKEAVDQIRVRAEEVQTDLIVRGIENPTIVVFDEYTNTGRTIRGLRRAFGNELPLYTFLVSEYYDDYPDIHPFEFGLLESESNLDPSIGRRLTGFEYRYSKDRGKYIGAKKSKSDVYAKLVEDASPSKMYTFRRELNEIGKSIASKL